MYSCGFLELCLCWLYHLILQAAAAAAQTAIKTLDSALASRDLAGASTALVIARVLPGLASHDFGPAEREIEALKVC